MMNLKIIVVAFLALIVQSCTVNKAKIDNNLKKYFDLHKVEGCFTMLKNTDGEITVYNMALDTQRFAPAGTFTLVNALVGLHTGKITTENMVLNWDGVRRPVKEWNRNMSMMEALKINNVSYFQQISRRIGMDTMKAWVDSIAYGNKNMSGNLDSFWQDNTLKISPDEQLGLLKKIYFDQLPFRKSVMQIVREAIVKEDNTAYKLSFITGTVNEDQHQVGWVAGWIEENRHVYFFVTLVRNPDISADMKGLIVDITRDILKEYGFFQGKM